MANLFRNNYKVYLYKYNYKALQSQVEHLLKDNSANKFLFESFVTNLYTLGIPSDEVIKKISSKYKDYVKEFKTTKSISNKNKKIVQNIGESQTIEYKAINDSPDNNVKNERATISLDDNILQEALAQNYALQKLQQDYENDMMKSSSAQINWMSTMQSRQTYDSYINNALKASKKLLNELFDPVIEDLAAIQSGAYFESEYVHVIDLTDLSEVKVLEKVETDRTKYSSSDFMTTSSSGELADDLNTNAVDSIGVITTTVEGLSNVTSFNLRQNVLLRHGITIEANDIIEIVDTNINTSLKTNKTYSESMLRDRTQFIGFVTKVSLNQRFSEASLLNVTCEGISKMLSLNPTINSNAVAPQFESVAGFISGTDRTQTTSDAKVVNVFSTFFDGLNAYDLFVKLLSDVLAVSPVKDDMNAYSMRLISDPEKLKTLPYQYSKPLLILYHFAVTCSTIRNISSQSQMRDTHIILARLDNNINQEKLQAYLLMIRSQYDLFWSNMNTPINILQTLASNTFLEVFEDRTGILILRPPRYNTWIEGDIIEEDNFIEWTQSIDDSTLKSRSDYQWSIPLLGVQNEFCGGYYQDIPALLKYGFRADAPKSSPSVQSEIDAAVYSALDVTKANSNTRTFELTVPLTQDYKLGCLYYFPEKNIQSISGVGIIASKGFVGYLTTITTTIAPGNVDTHRLTFKYMRAAECLDARITDEGVAGKSITILNFKRLPELGMYQSSVTESMLTKTGEKNLNEKLHKLVSNSRYYWAAYFQPHKDIFDAGIQRNKTIPKSDIKQLYKTLAPTNIRVGTFQSLNGMKSKDYIPTQQLINAIWCADILSRTGYVPPKNKVYKIYPTRQLRTRDNTKKLFEFLKKDKTITDIQEVNYLEKETKSLSAPYATVNKTIKDGNKTKSAGVFLIKDSLVPNIKTEFGAKEQNLLKEYMSSVKTAYKLYNADDDFYLWYQSEHKDINNKMISNEFDAVNACINVFDECENNIYNYPNFSNKYEKSKTFMDELLTYYDLKHQSSVEKVSNALSKLVDAAMKVIPIGGLPNIVNIKKLFNTIKKYAIQDIKAGVPAYLVNASAQLPAVHSLKGTGSYIAGVCPIDYSNYIRNTLNPKIKVALENRTITLTDSNIITANGYPIGTITKLIFDDSLSNDYNNLYFYPVIELYKDADLSKAYAGMQNLNTRISNTYMLTEAEITDFIENKKSNKKSNKKVACVIRITPTCVPETKIPTIQQVYNQGGLYVGYDEKNNKKEINTKKAIFNPGVLYEWTKSEIENLYTVNVYNFIECCNSNLFGTYLSCTSKNDSGTELNIELLREIPWLEMITNSNVCRVPCVSNTKLKISELEIPFNADASSKVRTYFSELSQSNLFFIGNCEEQTGFMCIVDATGTTGPASNEVLFLLLSQIYLDETYSGSWDSLGSELATPNKQLGEDVKSSYTTEIDKGVLSAFLTSVLDKEYTQVGLYDWGPYMPYDTEDLYPNSFQMQVYGNLAYESKKNKRIC